MNVGRYGQADADRHRVSARVLDRRRQRDLDFLARLRERVDAGDEETLWLYALTFLETLPEGWQLVAVYRSIAKVRRAQAEGRRRFWLRARAFLAGGRRG